MMSANGWLHGLQNNLLTASDRGLRGGCPHIAKDDPATAVRIGNALIDRVEILENFPLLGAPYPKRSGVRKLVSRPYLIFYRPRLEENSVDILRYWHAAQRDPDL